MEFGLFSLFDFFPDRQNEVEYYQDTLELSILAEQLGFDSVWFGEEHFYSFGICPSPQIFLTAVARETSRIRLGPAISLLPFENPLRKAEDFAMLDILSNGRLNFGVGRGIIGKHFEGFCIDPAESRARYQEALEIIRRAWSGRTTGSWRKLASRAASTRPRSCTRCIASSKAPLCCNGANPSWIAASNPGQCARWRHKVASAPVPPPNRLMSCSSAQVSTSMSSAVSNVLSTGQDAGDGAAVSSTAAASGTTTKAESAIMFIPFERL